MTDLLALSHVLGHLVSLVLDLLDVTNHVKGHLWQVVVLALHDALETLDGVSDLYVLACSNVAMQGDKMPNLLLSPYTRQKATV